MLEQIQHFFSLLTESRIEIFLAYFSNVHILWLILISCVITLIENIFPPAPSDMMIVAISIIVGVNGQSIIPVILACTVGSTIGFLIMYKLGAKFENSIVERERFKFIKKESLHKVEQKFKKWGFKLVVANRFMSGTRAVISFFAGMSQLDLKKTTIYSAISSFLWYAILSISGDYFGKDWKKLLYYIKQYDKAAITIFMLLISIGILFWIFNKFIKPHINNKKEQV